MIGSHTIPQPRRVAWSNPRCYGSWNSQDSILPSSSIRGGPNQHEFLDHRTIVKVCFTRNTPGLEPRVGRKLPVMGHCSEIMRNENSILLRRDSQHL
jgi:hypothetical protein